MNMRIKKQTTKPVTVSFDVDRIEIVTENGSQSTDYTVLLKDSGKTIHRQDVPSLEQGLIWCMNNLLNSKQKKVLGTCDVDEI